MQKNQKKSQGFTLIELMITVAIIGILAAIAYPSYTESVRKAKRKDAVFALTDIANRLERYYTENNKYTGATITNLGLSSSITPDGLYTLSVPSLTATTFTVTATPVSTGPQAQDSKCGSLSITSTGSKTATGTLGNVNCWK